MEDALDIRCYGARADDQTAAQENSDAFDKAQEAIPRTRTEGPAGWRIFVPPGTFSLARNLHIVRGVHIFGSGPGGASILKLAPRCSVVIETDPNAADCILRDLQIVSEEGWLFTTDKETVIGNDKTTDFSTGTPGIHMRTKAHVIRCSIVKFSGTAILIDADPSRGGNANNWSIEGGGIFGSGGHGVHVSGQETTGGYCSGLYLSGIGGHGIYDHSFGGCTWIALYVEGARSRGYLADNALSIFLGCRAEGTKPMLLSNGHVFLGGTGQGLDPLCRGLVGFGGSRIYPFTVSHAEKGGAEVVLRDYENTEYALGWTHDDEKANGQKMFWDLIFSKEHLVWELSRTGHLPACYFTAKRGTQDSHEAGEGLIGFPDFLLGASPRSPLKFSVTRAQSGNPEGKPEDPDGKQGDIRFFDSPEPGGHIGWVKTGRGWKKFGLIES